MIETLLNRMITGYVGNCSTCKHGNLEWQDDVKAIRCCLAKRLIAAPAISTCENWESKKPPLGVKLDRNVYNYGGLIEDDKKHIDGFDAAIEEISEGCEEYVAEQLCADHEDMESIAGQMKRELISAAFQYILQVLESKRQDIIVSMIDGYNDE